MLATRLSVSVRLPGEVVRPGGSQVGSQWPRRGQACSHCSRCCPHRWSSRRPGDTGHIPIAFAAELTRLMTGSL